MTSAINTFIDKNLPALCAEVAGTQSTSHYVATPLLSSLCQMMPVSGMNNKRKALAHTLVTSAALEFVAGHKCEKTPAKEESEVVKELRDEVESLKRKLRVSHIIEI